MADRQLLFVLTVIFFSQRSVQNPHWSCPEVFTKNTSGTAPPDIRSQDSSSEEEEQYSGKPYTLRCCVSGDPTPGIEWRKDGKSLTQHFMLRRFELMENEQVLNIYQVLPEDTGIYTCKAINAFGHANWTIDFYVFEMERDQKPVVHITRTSWTVPEGDNITLKCIVSGSTSRPVIIWLREHANNQSRFRLNRNRAKQTVTPNKQQNNAWISNLTIHHVTAEDNGSYICRAKNGQGQGSPSEESTILTIANIQDGDAVLSSRPLEARSTHTHLRWGLVVIGVLLAIALSVFMWYLRRRRGKKVSKHKCPAAQHGSGGDDECICEVKFDVFISYNSNDKDWVDSVLRDGLTSRYKVCMDAVDFEPGKYIAENIVHNIWVSRKILLVLSKNFLKSEWCCFEKQIAQGKVVLCKDSLIVIMLENLKLKELPKDLRHYKLQKTYLEWNNDDVKPHFWKRLTHAIGPSSFPQETGEEEV